MTLATWGGHWSELKRQQNSEENPECSKTFLSPWKSPQKSMRTVAFWERHLLGGVFTLVQPGLHQLPAPSTPQKSSFHGISAIQYAFPQTTPSLFLHCPQLHGEALMSLFNSCKKEQVPAQKGSSRSRLAAPQRRCCQPLFSLHHILAIQTKNKTHRSNTFSYGDSENRACTCDACSTQAFNNQPHLHGTHPFPMCQQQQPTLNRAHGLLQGAQSRLSSRAGDHYRIPE